jgi:hypothetical protein
VKLASVPHNRRSWTLRRHDRSVYGTEGQRFESSWARSWETALRAPVVTVVGYEALGYRHMSEALEPLGSRSGASLRAGGLIRVALQHVGAARARSDGPDARPGRPPGGRGR